MYFLRRLRPFEVAGDRVRSLCVSLNAPVLTAPDLPPGPARAVIVVHREARGQMDATVGVRSLASGEIAYWSFDGELRSDADLSVAADAALTFAESLGFLFDEPALSGGAQADKAFRAWLAGDDAGAVNEPPARGPTAAGARAASLKSEPLELELNELVMEDLPAAESETPPPSSGAAAAPAGAPNVSPPIPVPAIPVPAKASLSKFRAREAAPAPAAGARKKAARQPLARVQLVKRRSPEDERKLVIRRLLTSF